MTDRSAWGAELGRAAALGPGQARRICRLCIDTLDITGAGISLVTPSGNRGVVCATDDISQQIEQLQFTLGEGPCVDAVTSGGPVLVADLEDRADIARERWPGFLEAATSHKVRAIFAFPLSVGPVCLGALDLWRDRPGDLAPHDLAAALMAADAAAVSLLHLDPTADEFLDDVRGGASYQFTVHQATGMVAAQLEVPVEEALIRLRARSFAEDLPLHDLAQDVIDRRTRFTPEDP